MSSSNAIAQKNPAAADTTISERLAGFAHALRYDDIPEAVRARAKFLILDGVGIAFASTHYDFSNRILAGIRDLSGPGGCSVIGLADRLPLRDAVLMNGALVHGLDYDDTHMAAIVHATSSCFPCALGVAEQLDVHGRDLLAAYVVGMEAAIRIGAAAQGGFHDVGFHPTGVIGHFATAMIAGRLFGLDPGGIAAAQGIAGSTAAGSQEFLSEGAWNKRIHPGWAGGAGITAASLAKNGFVAPSQPYEGRFGLFKAYLGERERQVDYAAITDGLGTRWETPEMAIKPYPTCHFTHSIADSALALRREHDLAAEDIARIRALIPRETVELISEPVANKKRPSSDYDAKFSTQYITACCFVRGRLGLAELEPEALNDPEILAVADKVECEADTNSAFPTFFSGGVVVTTRDGRELVHHERVNRGAGDRALTGEEITEKFMENMALVTTVERARAVRDLVLGLDTVAASALARGLAA
ncbi:MAG: MmgE/PrpD family protein [Alphaproteobacteria bacterium]|nr:MmgE/PrpD family protein [Alphaproteobacteria bacterium]